MAQFNSGNSNFTPVASTTQANNWVLTMLTAGDMAQIKMIGWGGSGTSLVGYTTRWGRVNSTPATPTSLNITSTAPGITPNSTVNTYGTPATIATSPATGLWTSSWNVQGGGGTIVLPIGGEWVVIGGSLGSTYNQIACGNVAGADANLSSYTLQFAE